MEKYESLVKSGGVLVVNSTLVKQQTTRDDIEAIYVPANDLASDWGNVKMANVVLVGAMLAKRPIVPLEAVEKVLDEHLVGKKQRFIEPNKHALRRGAEYALTGQ
jgi:2-oxoglutarate ferredoxin oxidoreductase subunit gamma